jgi:cytidyltransferase-like protein
MNRAKIWVNGTFDVIHYGHLQMLKFADQLGELHIGLDSDERIKSKKGPSRPFHTHIQRWEMLNTLFPKSQIYRFNTDHELEIHIMNIKPDLMVIGSDYKNKPIIGRQFVKQILFFERLEQFSTTKILEGWDIK